MGWSSPFQGVPTEFESRCSLHLSLVPAGGGRLHYRPFNGTSDSEQAGSAHGGPTKPPSKEEPMTTTLEIRPAEGGEDSALFAADLLRAYRRMCEREG